MEDAQATTLTTLGVQMQYLRADVERQAKLLQDISLSLRALTAVEIHQEQILGSMVEGKHRMDNLEKRVDVVEQALPGLIETRRWVVGGIVSAVAMMAAALFQLSVLGPLTQMQNEHSSPQAPAPRPKFPFEVRP